MTSYIHTRVVYTHIYMYTHIHMYTCVHIAPVYTTDHEVFYLLRRRQAWLAGRLSREHAHVRKEPSGAITPIDIRASGFCWDRGLYGLGSWVLAYLRCKVDKAEPIPRAICFGARPQGLDGMIHSDVRAVLDTIGVVWLLASIECTSCCALGENTAALGSPQSLNSLSILANSSHAIPFICRQLHGWLRIFEAIQGCSGNRKAPA